jgi:hypothetical protein
MSVLTPIATTLLVGVAKRRDGPTTDIETVARALLLLANYGNDFGLEPTAIKVNQETLASLI